MKRVFHLQLLLPLAEVVGWFCTSSLRHFLQTELGWWRQVQQISACLKIALSGSAPVCCSTGWSAGMAALAGVITKTWSQSGHWKSSPELMLFAQPSAAHTQTYFLSMKSDEKLTPAFLKYAENVHWRARYMSVYHQNWIHFLSTKL